MLDIQYKKNDYIYYHSNKLGTIPAIIIKVGKSDNKNKDSVLINGDAPNKRGSVNAWVHISNIEHQTPRCNEDKKYISNLAVNCARCKSDKNCIYQS